MAILYTIGHSNHPIAAFLDLLRRHGVAVLVDVRALPHSRRFTQFRKRDLAQALETAGIAYRWMGDRLGGIRHRDDAASFAELARRPDFQAALDELETLAGETTPAIMCAEREPLDCHRSILIARHLRNRPLELRHIRADGTLETQAELEQRLLAATRRARTPLLDGGDSLEAAYDARAARITGVRPERPDG